MSTCLLCHANTVSQKAVIQSIPFFECKTCGCIFKDPATFPSANEERQRYLLHQNDVTDAGYQKFVEPLVSRVRNDFHPTSTGLDYGAGTGPVITKLLTEKGYEMNLYDPFFHPNLEVLTTKYNFIVCCEVMEHFHRPQKEFHQLHSYLLPTGKLYCMTELYSEQLNFDDWHYKNDLTHVLFYTEDSVRWIADHVGFSKVEFDDRLVVFTY